MSSSRRLLAVLVIAAVGLGAPACATAAGSDAPPSSGAVDVFDFAPPTPPDGEVMAQGTVLDTGTSVELCLGAIMESHPPQCRGITLADWSWDGVDGSETASGVRWGAYALQGRYDGASFTVTQPPIMLALYDPMVIPQEPSEPGVTDEETLLGIQEELSAVLGDTHLSSFPTEGRLWVDVVWDDGSLQGAADKLYGAGVVVFRSALREVTG